MSAQRPGAAESHVLHPDSQTVRITSSLLNPGWHQVPGPEHENGKLWESGAKPEMSAWAAGWTNAEQAKAMAPRRPSNFFVFMVLLVFSLMETATEDVRFLARPPRSFFA